MASAGRFGVEELPPKKSLKIPFPGTLWVRLGVWGFDPPNRLGNS
jgi:hypothetical protein